MKAKFSIKENGKDPFDMNSKEADQIHLEGGSFIEVSTVADGNAMIHAEGLSIKEEGQELDKNPEPIDIHLTQGDKVELSTPDGKSSWEITLVSTQS
ncbi:MAG TPA: hypothetical protein VIH52_04380 [Candidatus Nanoarchaeia archaeon]